MKTLLFVAVLIFSIGTALSAVKYPLETGSALFANRHAQIEALTSN
jgi:hypothetical protein